MVNGSQIVGSVGAGAPLFTRVSSSPAASSTDSNGAAHAVAAQPAAQSALVSEQAYRYNTFEFSYRQDVGKIVLLRQRPDTGEVVQQFPSEYLLRKYADGARVARSAEGNGAEGNGGAQVTKATGGQGGNGRTTILSPASDGSAAAANVVPTIPSAPALPSAGTNSSRVDISI